MALVSSKARMTIASGLVFSAAESYLCLGRKTGTLNSRAAAVIGVSRVGAFGARYFYLASTEGGRIGIDTGAYATGRLTAALIAPGWVEFLST